MNQPTAQALTRTQLRDMAWHLHGQSHLAVAEHAAPMVVVRGEGVHLWDEEGRRYLDAMAGSGNATLGYSEPRLAEAAYRQMLRLPLQPTFGDRTTEPIAELAQRLVQLAPCPMGKAFFAGSGSEANDSALMLAWHHWHVLGQPSRRKVVSLQRSYHGSTVASASLNGFAHMQQSFGLPLPGFIHITCPDYYREAHSDETEDAFGARMAAELEETLVREGPETVAAFFIEPVMGLGGIIVPPVSYARRVQEVLRRYGVLLVVDEVASGFGRTGRFWGSQSVGLEPDLLVCSKGLTAGYMPMSAVLVSEAVCDVLRGYQGPGFSHGFTQGGHPVAAAVALEVLTLYDERHIEANVLAMGQRLGAALEALQGHPLVGQVRGSGLMWAVDLVADKGSGRPFDPAWGVGGLATRFAQEQGVIVRMVGDCILTVPPLIVNADNVDRIAAAILSSVESVAEQLPGRSAAAA